MEANTNIMTIFQPQNIGSIAQAAPQAWTENNQSHDRCLKYAQVLLDMVRLEGMSADLDKEIAVFLERARKTVSKMKQKRSPVTQLFDSIRSSYAALENDIDPGRKDTLPEQLQQMRNLYADELRQQEEQKRRERQRLMLINQAKEAHAANCLQTLRQIVVAAENRIIQTIDGIVSATTLENYQLQLMRIEQMTESIPATTVADRYSPQVAAICIEQGIPGPERLQIEQRVLNENINGLIRQSTDNIRERKQRAIDIMPSKRKELERMASAEKEEAEHIRKQMEERERMEAERREKERAEREAKEKAAAELAAKKQEMDSLFGSAQAQAVEYQPKTSVKKRINVLNPDGFMQVVGMWWAQHGCTLSVAELEKEFKKQLTFCNKLANDKDHPVFIQSEHIEYVDDVKAK